MEKIYTLIYLFSSTLLFTYPHSLNAQIKECPLPDEKWMVTVDGYDSKTIIELAAKFEEAAKADAQRLKLTEKNDELFISELSKILELSSRRKVEVSQSFYEAYRINRDALCAILLLLDRTDILDSTRRHAEKQFIEISKNWASIKNIETSKCNLRPTDQVHFYFFFTQDDKINLSKFTLPIIDVERIKNLGNILSSFYKYLPKIIDSSKYFKDIKIFRKVDEQILLPTNSGQNLLKDCNNGLLLIPKEIIAKWFDNSSHFAFTRLYSEILNPINPFQPSIDEIKNDLNRIVKEVDYGHSETFEFNNGNEIILESAITSNKLELFGGDVFEYHIYTNEKSNINFSLFVGTYKYDINSAEGKIKIWGHLDRPLQAKLVLNRRINFSLKYSVYAVHNESRESTKLRNATPQRRVLKN